MSGRFVQFWVSLEQDVVINADRVVSFDQSGDKCRLVIDDGTDDGTLIFVAGALEEVKAKLNGEQP